MDASSAAEDLGRQLWRKARQQLNDYELQLQEKQLELQHETRSCQQQKEATARLLKEAAQLRTTAAELQSAALQLYSKLKVVQEACEAVRADAVALAQHLNMARLRLERQESCLKGCREVRKQQIAEHEAHNQSLRNSLPHPAAASEVTAGEA